MDIPPYTHNEEVANYWTHGIAALLAFIGLVYMVNCFVMLQDAYLLFGVFIFGVTMTLTFAASTAYHYVSRVPLKQTLRLLDHLAIYLLIAGSYSPFTLGNMRYDSGWLIFGLIWLLAFIGMTFKIAVRNDFEKYERVDPFIYLAMGFVAAFFLDPLYRCVAPDGIWWLIFGGLSYIIGIGFFQWSSLRYHHAVWHLFVICGAFSHVYAVVNYVHLPVK
jgi:hemolysin III